MEEEKDNNLEKGNIILCYIFLVLNILIIFFTLILVRSKLKKIRIFKCKLFALITLDSISYIFSTKIFKNSTYFYNTIVVDILLTCLSSIEFYLIISFIYQIYNYSKISKLAKKIVLKEPLQLSFLFFFVTFSYHKYWNLIPKITFFIEQIIILSCITLLFRYLRNKTKIIKINLSSRDINIATIYNHLKMLNSVSFLLLICYNYLKLMIIYTPNIFKMYIHIILNTINFGFKYFMFFSFTTMVYRFHKNINTDETDKIIYTHVLN